MSIFTFQLPEALAKALQERAHNTALSTLKKAAAGVTATYRSERDKLSDLRLGPLEKEAYLQMRLPATYPVLAQALNTLKNAAPGFSPASFLDVGAGPGTGLWAAMQVFPEIQRATLIEQDPEWIRIGQNLLSTADFLPKATWIQADMTQRQNFPEADIVAVSYALNELSPAVLESTIDFLWQAARRALLIIEPGSRQGFHVIRQARALLIKEKAFLAAPCPHHKSCPMAGDNWCHFQQKVIRSAAHRQAKNGTLSHEVEKFSYVLALKEKAPPLHPYSRIVAAPLMRSGHVRLDLCIPQGDLRRVTITRRQGQIYRAARKAEWGDTWINPA